MEAGQGGRGQGRGEGGKMGIRRMSPSRVSVGDHRDQE